LALDDRDNIVRRLWDGPHEVAFSVTGETISILEMKSNRNSNPFVRCEQQNRPRGGEKGQTVRLRYQGRIVVQAHSRARWRPLKSPKMGVEKKPEDASAKPPFKPALGANQQANYAGANEIESTSGLSRC